MCSKTPSPVHSCKRRQQVLSLGRSTGDVLPAGYRVEEPKPALQVFPVIRPEPSAYLAEARWSGKCGTIRSQCSSLRMRLVFRNMIGFFHRQ